MLQVLQGLCLVSGFVFCGYVMWACLLDSCSAGDLASRERVDRLLTRAMVSLRIALLSLFTLLLFWFLSTGGFS
jgi:hypothetical protein